MEILREREKFLSSLEKKARAVTNTLDVKNKVSVYDTYSDSILCQCIRSTTVALCVSHIYCAISVQHLCESGRYNDCTRLQLLRVGF